MDTFTMSGVIDSSSAIRRACGVSVSSAPRSAAAIHPGALRCSTAVCGGLAVVCPPDRWSSNPIENLCAKLESDDSRGSSP